MAEQPKYAAPQAEVAWLEKALFLAAQELAAFRANAQAERERAQQVLTEAQARVRLLEAERADAERRHTAELERTHAHFDRELAERASAWNELGKDLAERSQASGRAHEQWQLEAERAGRLARELNLTRAQLLAAETARDGVFTGLTKLEESYAATAATLREAKDQSTATRAQVDRLCVELDQSMVRCRQLEQEAVTLAKDAGERSEALAKAEAKLEVAEQDAASARARLAELERTGSELSGVSAELERERTARRAAVEQLERTQAELTALRRKADEAQAQLSDARQALEGSKVERESLRKAALSAQAEQEALKQEREQGKRVLDADLNARLEAAKQALEELRVERERTEREKGVALATEQESARKERDRGTKLQAELEATQRQRDEARTARDIALRTTADAGKSAEATTRMHADREAAIEALRRERDEARAELAQHQDTRLAMLDTEKERAARLKLEVDALQIELERTRSERDTMRDELASQQRVAAGQPPLKVESLRPAPPSRAEHAHPVTVPIDRTPANEVTESPTSQPRRPGKGTSYSVNEVQEEQVFVRKGGGGGKGQR